jgi:hypothetical protein
LWWWDVGLFTSSLYPVRLTYQPPDNSTFLSEQTRHQQPTNMLLFLSKQISQMNSLMQLFCIFNKKR